MFAFPFLIFFISLMAYTGRYKRYPLRVIEITDNVNSSYPGEARHRRYSGYSSSSVSSPMVMYCAKYCDGTDHIFTFKTLRNSPSIFPSYERGETLMAYVSPDYKSAAPEKAIAGLRKIAGYILVLYLGITCVFEVIPAAYQYIKSINPQISPKKDTLFMLVLFVVLGLAFSILGSSLVRTAAKNRKDRRNGLYRSVHATVTHNIEEVGVNSNSTFYPVFIYTINGTTETMQGKWGTRPPKYQSGEDVILYQNIKTLDMKEPSDFKIGLPVFFMVIGILLLIGAIFLFF